MFKIVRVGEDRNLAYDEALEEIRAGRYISCLYK